MRKSLVTTGRQAPTLSWASEKNRKLGLLPRFTSFESENLHLDSKCTGSLVRALGII